MSTVEIEALTHTPTLYALAAIFWTILGLTVWNQKRPRYKRNKNRKAHK